ncbi:MAG: hypothetical protein KatS3mg068_0017 [Candidatus Sericytochromatia bacterium]|nr:MAG: hypothetical protein KatS3mg068_0017 [Candidatus Sericytochromatia bacterium]
METFRNISSNFKSTLDKASGDKIINKNELDELKKKAKSKDEKDLVKFIETRKDKSTLSFEIKNGNANSSYNLSLDIEEKEQSRYEPNTRSYSSLGQGNIEVARNVSEQQAVSRPLGDLDSISNEYNTPEKIASLLGSIPYDTERGKPLGGDGPLGARSPDETLKIYSGVCRDIHQVGAYLLSKNGYEAIQMGYVGARTSHSFTVYKEPGGKGYGVVEYGKVYSPEYVSKLLGGRYASSPEEALNALNLGTATAIYKWTPPKEGQVGYVEGVFYTDKHKNYHKTLQLEHKDRIIIDRQLGVEIEKTLGDKWSVKAGVNFDSPSDPTAAGAVHASVGYRTGDNDNYFSLSLGTQFRPNEGSRIVGTMDWLTNPTLLAGADIRGKWTPYKLEYLPGHFMTTSLTGNLSGAFLALNKEKETDAGEIKLSDKWGYDLDYVSGLADSKLGLRHGFYGDLGKHFSYSTGLFAEYDVNLAVAGMSMGAPHPFLFFNTGVDGRINYHNEWLDLGLSGKYLFTQVNNSNTSGVGLDARYKRGNFELFGRADYLKSVEGSRLQFTEGVRWRPDNRIALTAQSQQEIVIPDSGKHYVNPGGINATLNAELRF